MASRIGGVPGAPCEVCGKLGWAYKTWIENGKVRAKMLCFDHWRKK